jgi:glucokinase
VTSIGLIGRVRRAPRAAATLAADLSGPRVRVGLVVDGRVEQHEQCAAGDDNVATFLDAGARLISVVGCARIGLAFPGVIDGDKVIPLYGPLASLDRKALAGICEDELGLPASFVNDAVAAGIGEARYGAGRGAQRAVVMTVGKGVGVCVLENGIPLGSGPWAGGILGGQIPVVESSEQSDLSGNRGTVEAVCAAQRLVDYSGPAYATVTDVLNGLRRGDVMARHGVTRYRRMLVRALVALVNAHSPDRVVIGGTPFLRGSTVLDGVEEELRRRLRPALPVAVRRASLGDRAPLLGIADSC